MNKLICILLFFSLLGCCFGNVSKNKDRVEIVISFSKRQLKQHNIPDFFGENYSYTYSLSADTLQVKIDVPTDTANVKSGKYIYFDMISSKSKTQVLKIPSDCFQNTKYLLIELNRAKTYLFSKRRNNRFSFQVYVFSSTTA